MLESPERELSVIYCACRAGSRAWWALAHDPSRTAVSAAQVVISASLGGDNGLPFGLPMRRIELGADAC